MVDIDFGGSKIVNLTDPTNAQGAATKNYVDSQIPLPSDLSETLSVNNTTDGYDIVISTGDVIIITDAPVNSTDGVNKAYVDSYVTANAILNGSSAGGDLFGTYPNPTVAKLQHNLIESSSLGGSQDGYILTWSAVDGYWVARPPVAPALAILRKDYFTSNNTWTCPAGVTNILIIAAGGGGGGAGGLSSGSTGGGGGGGSVQVTGHVTVTPGVTYNITIGAGGSGGAATLDGTAGSPSIFGSNLFRALGGGNGWANGAAYGLGGQCVKGTGSPVVNYESKGLAMGGNGGVTAAGKNGNYQICETDGAFTPGSGGSNGSTRGGGGSGGAGPKGSGGTGGNGVNLAVGGTGVSGGANTGAGGGGGGASSTTGGAGGSGGSGYLYVIWVG